MRRRSASTLELQLERHRRELTAYCYRMLGSPFEAEDAVQETFLRAWRAFDRFEGRSALRSWLYRIATNVCLDMLNGRERRPADGPRPVTRAGGVEPQHAAGGDVDSADPRRARRGERDPAEVTEARETIRLAFVAALQHLPPRQRAVLILCEVLRWKASEVAELLETSVASVSSALQRARATLEESDLAAATTSPSVDEADAELLARYLDAFERYDMEALTSLIHEDATQSMPPYDLWLTGRKDIFSWWIRARDRLSRLARRAGDGSQRSAGLRPVQAARGRRRLRAVGPAGARSRRRQDRRAHVLPRHGDGLPAVRAAARVQRGASRQRMRPVSRAAHR